MGTQEGSMAMEGVQVDGATRVHVKRPKIPEEGEEEEEILALRGVAVPAGTTAKMDIFISHKDHSSCENCQACSDCRFAGSVLMMPGRQRRLPPSHESPRSNHRLGIGEVLRELNIHGDDSFYLAIVPSVQPTQTPISISSIALEYE